MGAVSNWGREEHLAEIRKAIAMHEFRAADERREELKYRELADKMADAALFEDAMVSRWQIVHDAVRFGQVPNLDGCTDPTAAADAEEVPF